MSPVGNPRRNDPSPNRRRALELLAASPHGATEAILVAHGLTVDLLVELVRAGLAAARAERALDASYPRANHRGGAAGGRGLRLTTARC
jgi:hypothetical protein